MTTYYIDLTAGIDGAGTTHLVPRNVIPTLASNNTYLFAGGRTHNVTAQLQTTGLTNIDYGTYSPTTGARIYPTQIGAKPNGAPVFDWSAMAMVVQIGSAQYVFNISNGTNITIDGLRVRYAGSHATPLAIGSTSTSAGPITLNRYEITNDLSVVSAATNAFQVGNGSPVSVGRMTATNGYIHDIACDALFFAGGNAGFNFSYNVIERISMLGANGDGVQATAQINNAVIRGNYIDHEAADGKQCIILSVCTGSGADISDNYIKCFRRPVNTLSNAGIYTSLPNSIVARNVIFNGQYSVNMEGANGVAHSNLLIFDDVSPAVLQMGFRIGGALQDIYNNTIVKTAKSNNGATALNHLNAAYTVSFRNNVVFGFDQGVTLQATGYTENNNAFFSNTSNSNRTLGTGAVTADPLLADSYQPKVGSPLLGAGTHLGYKRDIQLKQRPNPPSIGAYDVATLSAVAGVTANWWG